MRSGGRHGQRQDGGWIGDPVALALGPGTRAVRGRLAVSVRAAMAAGAWVGFALGLFFGAAIGAGVVWFSGAVVDWQRELAFTFGVARRLLPFGDQLGLLRELELRWWLVIPVVALAVGAVAALVGALLGGILAAAYNRSPRHALVVVEFPATSAGPADEAAAETSAGRPPGSPSEAVLHSPPHGDDREE